MIGWRATRLPYADLSGKGGLIVPGRWHSIGRPVVYFTEHPALALLEVRVHLDIPAALLPPDFVIMRVYWPDHLATVDLRVPSPDEKDSRIVGDQWLASGVTCLAKVESVLSPHSFNYLFNPLHQDSAYVSTVDITPFSFDHRLW